MILFSSSFFVFIWNFFNLGGFSDLSVLAFSSLWCDDSDAEIHEAVCGTGPFEAPKSNGVSAAVCQRWKEDMAFNYWDAYHILKTELLQSNDFSQYFLVWRLHPSGTFYSKSAYQTMLDSIPTYFNINDNVAERQWDNCWRLTVCRSRNTFILLVIDFQFLDYKRGTATKNSKH